MIEYITLHLSNFWWAHVIIGALIFVYYEFLQGSSLKAAVLAGNIFDELLKKNPEIVSGQDDAVVSRARTRIVVFAFIINHVMVVLISMMAAILSILPIILKYWIRS